MLLGIALLGLALLNSVSSLLCFHFASSSLSVSLGASAFLGLRLGFSLACRCHTVRVGNLYNCFVCFVGALTVGLVFKICLVDLFIACKTTVIGEC